MDIKEYFIKATEEFNTFEKPVPAYYFRRTLSLEASKKVKITVAVCGFYELYLNGENITGGFLSPYVSNPEHYIYCDEYEVELQKGENVIGLILGNGFQNNPGGHIWDFDKASFRSAPLLSLTVTSDEKLLLKSDCSFKVAPSAIRSDDYRFGEFYDARFELKGWANCGFDDSDWQNAISATAPAGEIRVADVAPIVKTEELSPVEIVKRNGAYFYDFGISNAGVCRLKIKGERGQKIELTHADSIKDGDLDIAQIWFVREHWERDRHIVHKDTYICGGGEEIYQPRFTYHGFRYVKVTGITDEQATKELLTFVIYHTELNTKGGFTCSDKVASTLQKITRRSIESNFHHIPTDCPQREKNGWTADAALSCEAALLNFDPERNWREWMRNICKAQNEDGAIPGIVPTSGWGFEWGNGPAWDCVIAYLPYYVYIYRGKTEMITEAAPSLLTYLRYLRGRADKRGILAIGLGDWCHVNDLPPKAPLALTDTVMAMDIAEKTAVMLDAVGMKSEADFARGEAESYRKAIRANLIDFDTMLASGSCQSSQTMWLYYVVF